MCITVYTIIHYVECLAKDQTYLLILDLRRDLIKIESQTKILDQY